MPADVAVLYSPWQRLRATNSDWTPSGQIKRSRVDNDPITNMLKDPYFGYVGPTLVRRSALLSVDGFQPEMRLGEDLDLMLRIAMAGWRFRVVDSADPLFFYRDTPESLWHKASSDCDSVMRWCRTIRSAEPYLGERDGDRMRASTKRTIASKYRWRLGALRSCDPDNFELVVSWISELRCGSLKSPGSHSSIPAKSPISRMGMAKMRGNFVFRGMLATLRHR